MSKREIKIVKLTLGVLLQRGSGLLSPISPVDRGTEAGVGPRCREFMFMGKVGTICLYTHIWTRRYLHLDPEGQAYRFTGEGYSPVQLNEALNHVFN